MHCITFVFDWASGSIRNWRQLKCEICLSERFLNYLFLLQVWVLLLSLRGSHWNVSWWKENEWRITTSPIKLMLNIFQKENVILCIFNRVKQIHLYSPRPWIIRLLYVTKLDTCYYPIGPLVYLLRNMLINHKMKIWQLIMIMSINYF